MGAEPTIVSVDDDPGIRESLEGLLCSMGPASQGVGFGKMGSRKGAPATVKVHRGQVMRKMQAASLPDLARMADKLNVIIAEKH
jgi:FixJ family two-component response regulator